MKAMLLALGLTAAFAAVRPIQDREPKPRPPGAEACEIRIFLVDSAGTAASLRAITAAVVVPGKAGAPDRSVPMIVEIPLKSEAPPKDAPPARVQSAKVEGTEYAAEAVVGKHVPAADAESRPRQALPHPGPHFRTILDKGLLGEDGAFRVVFTIAGEKRVARGFSCHIDQAKAHAEGTRVLRDLDRAVAARDAGRATAALDRLRILTEEKPGDDPHRTSCEAAQRELRAAIDAGDWDRTAARLDACRTTRAECAEKCAPAPADERRRP